MQAEKFLSFSEQIELAEVPQNEHLKSEACPCIRNHFWCQTWKRAEFYKAMERIKPIHKYSIY